MAVKKKKRLQAGGALENIWLNYLCFQIRRLIFREVTWCAEVQTTENKIQVADGQFWDLSTMCDTRWKLGEKKKLVKSLDTMSMYCWKSGVFPTLRIISFFIWNLGACEILSVVIIDMCHIGKRTTFGWVRIAKATIWLWILSTHHSCWDYSSGSIAQISQLCETDK